MDAVIDTAFSLSYRNHVLHFLYPLFPPPASDPNSSHLHSLTRLLVTLSSPTLTSPLLKSLVPKGKLLAYQFAFDLAEGGSQDFLESIRNELPEDDTVSISPQNTIRGFDHISTRRTERFTKTLEEF